MQRCGITLRAMTPSSPNHSAAVMVPLINHPRDRDPHRLQIRVGQTNTRLDLFRYLPERITTALVDFLESSRFQKDSV